MIAKTQLLIGSVQFMTQIKLTTIPAAIDNETEEEVPLARCVHCGVKVPTTKYAVHLSVCERSMSRVRRIQTLVETQRREIELGGIVGCFDFFD
jgi:hypothetical protein